MSIIPLGFDPEGDPVPAVRPSPSAIGYFSRVNYQNGFDKLVDAFIELKKKDRIPGLTLNVCGGYTGIDKPFLSDQIKKIREAGLAKSIHIYPDFQGEGKMRFFNDVDVITVPVRKYDGYGLYLLEANASGIPVVQPDTGAFPEIVEKTGGGIIYSPDTVEELATSLYNLLTDSEQLAQLRSDGINNVRKEFSLARMSERLASVYEKTVKNA